MCPFNRGIQDWRFSSCWCERDTYSHSEAIGVEKEGQTQLRLHVKYESEEREAFRGNLPCNISIYSVLTFEPWALRGSFCFFPLMLIFQARRCRQGLVNNTDELPAIASSILEMSQGPLAFDQFFWSNLVWRKPMEPVPARNSSLQMNAE